ncbi:hypothetical protein AB7M25_002411 [Pseudomonas sp. AP3_22 TE3818]
MQRTPSVGAGLPAMAASKTPQGSRTQSPASRLLQESHATDTLCGRWLASDGGLENATRLKNPIAGKPAPTGIACNEHPLWALAGQRWRPRKRHKAQEPNRRQAGSYRNCVKRTPSVGAGLPAKAASKTPQGSRTQSPASRLLQELRATDTLCGRWLASDGGFENATRLKNPIAGKPAPTGIACNGHPLWTLAGQRWRPRKRHKAQGPNRRQAGSYRNCVKRTPSVGAGLPAMAASKTPQGSRT